MSIGLTDAIVTFSYRIGNEGRDVCLSTSLNEASVIQGVASKIISMEYNLPLPGLLPSWPAPVVLEDGTEINFGTLDKLKFDLPDGRSYSVPEYTVFTEAGLNYLSNLVSYYYLPTLAGGGRVEVLKIRETNLYKEVVAELDKDEDSCPLVRLVKSGTTISDYNLDPLLKEVSEVSFSLADESLSSSSRYTSRPVESWDFQLNLNPHFLISHLIGYVWRWQSTKNLKDLLKAYVYSLKALKEERSIRVHVMHCRPEPERATSDLALLEDYFSEEEFSVLKAAVEVCIGGYASVAENVTILNERVEDFYRSQALAQGFTDEEIAGDIHAAKFPK